jgi:hypothetical protein
MIGDRDGQGLVHDDVPSLKPSPGLIVSTPCNEPGSIDGKICTSPPQHPLSLDRSMHQDLVSNCCFLHSCDNLSAVRMPRPLGVLSSCEKQSGGVPYLDGSRTH